MQRFGFLAVMLVLGLSLAGCDACKDNVVTQLGDKVATLGKSGLEKEKIMADRKAARAVKCAEQKGQELKKKMGF
ncbi:MAG: hypothetical protein WC352_02495 [Candidatus Omnitrophota bacterium]